MKSRCAACSLSLSQGLQSVGGRGEPQPEAEPDGRGLCAGGGRTEAGTAHPDMQQGHEMHERAVEQPEISFLFQPDRSLTAQTSLGQPDSGRSPLGHVKPKCCRWRQIRCTLIGWGSIGTFKRGHVTATVDVDC